MKARVKINRIITITSTINNYMPLLHRSGASKISELGDLGRDQRLLHYFANQGLPAERACINKVLKQAKNGLT